MVTLPAVQKSTVKKTKMQNMQASPLLSLDNQENIEISKKKNVFFKFSCMDHRVPTQLLKCSLSIWS